MKREFNWGTLKKSKALYYWLGYTCILTWLDALLRIQTADAYFTGGILSTLSLGLYVPFIMSAGITWIVVGMLYHYTDTALSNILYYAVNSLVLVAISLYLMGPLYGAENFSRGFIYILTSGLAGAVWSFLALAWNRSMGEMSGQEIFITVVFCVLSSLVLSHILQTGIFSGVLFFAIPLLPCVSAICFHEVQDMKNESEDDNSTITGSASVTSKLFTSFVISLTWASFITNFCLALAIGLSGTRGFLITNVLGAIAFVSIMALSFRGPSFRFSIAYRALLFAIISSQLLLLIVTSGIFRSLAVAIENGAFLAVRVCFWCVVVYACNRMSEPLKMLGVSGGLGLFVIGVGMLSGSRVAQAIGNGVDPVVSEVIIVLSVLFTLFLYTTIFSERDADVLMETLPKKKKSFIDCCRMVAEQYALSPREEEVFILIATGHDINFIQEELLLSRSTVSTHRGHIYRKLGVHSKQEAIALVEAQRESHFISAA